ncbi:hypothetical protein KUV44_04825 [Marinobacter daepoensis]|uniref:Uncharacterized protein n=1 Tax=Marinobacter daepoensis TaxID=262077 RepID=A0ABS3BFV7_9GAMM|nr:hypothetical protein [Marinobacter daepoensis]MBN7769761.1 hypothetical protein [Marinobacter daepoensis]MBY6078451.1 hypothetical protein [Marinobacter daepoensis]
MAHAHPAEEHSDESAPVTQSRKKDLFRLSGPDTGHKPQSHLAAMKALSREGIRVIPIGPGHWVLRGSQPLPEIHCYSEQELQRFANSTARHYLTKTHRRPR